MNLDSYTREELIQWLVTNDRNGVYTDEDSEAEGLLPLTLEGARDLVRTILARD